MLAFSEVILSGMKISYPSITLFEQHVELKDYRPPTKAEYVRNVRRLANHFQCDPATLTEDRIRQYFLFLRQDRHSGSSTMKMVKYALLSFFIEHLKVKGWSVFDDLRISDPLVLPVVLSRSEVQKVLARCVTAFSHLSASDVSLRVARERSRST